MSQAKRRAIAIEDIYDHVVPVGLAATAKGDAVWSQRTIRAIRDKSPRKPVAHLVTAAVGSQAKALTAPGDYVDSGAAISPDGELVAFLRAHITDKPSPTELCVVARRGGTVRVIARELGDFSGLTFSRDSRLVAFSFRRANPLPDGHSVATAVYVDRLDYKLDGYGFVPIDRNRIYVVAADSAAPADLSPLSLGADDGAWDDTDPSFSPDGQRIAFLSNRGPSAASNPENRDLYVAPAAGGDAHCCTREEGILIEPVWAPNGKWIAALGCLGPPATMLMHTHVGLISIDPDGKRAERVLSSDIDYSLMNLTIDDLWGLDEWAQRPLFVAGGVTVLAPISERGTTRLVAFEVDADGSELGEQTSVISDRCVVSFCGGDTLCALLSSPDDPGIIVRCAADGSDLSEISAPLRAYVSEREVALPIELEVETPDGQAIQAWLYVPPGDGPHPVLLNIHGGPMVQFGTAFFHEVQTFVAAGYAVVHANPRGSQGYGIAFASAIARDWARKPFVDLMSSLDVALERDDLDATRVGVIGGSYGGYMTNWIVAHSNRFKAACTQRTVSHMAGLLCSDFGWSFGHELGSWPWDDPDHYVDQSPITYVKDIETPMLILQGLADHRTPADQGERLFVALRVLGKEAEMVLFPGAGHNLSRGGKPEQRVERLRAIHDWFGRKL